MSLASITVYCNESFRIPKWKEYYEDYKNEIAIHIIVDNNSSNLEYATMCKEFPESVILRLQKNGGITAAYNEGIRYVLDNDSIDTIALIGNDIKIEKGGLTTLNNFLMSNDKIGEVSPALLKKDSMIIEDNGDWFDYHLSMNEYDAGKTYSENVQGHISDGLPGAMNVAKKKMYKDIGLFDETIFMYSDEVDIGLKAKKKGYVFTSYPKVIAWHQHENANAQKERPPFSNYLTARNKVYLSGRYYSIVRKIIVFMYFLLSSLLMLALSIIRRDRNKALRNKWRIIGAWKGLINDMSHNKYSNPGGV
jgi:hypothetical protein